MVTLMLIPVMGYAIMYKMKDDQGSYIFACDHYAGQRIKIKLIDKNKYKVLAKYMGKIVYAETPFKAAQIVCGEIPENPPQKKDQPN